jgi:hypothetical protein
MSDNSDEEEPKSGGETQNPWVYYYLRYFVGAVVGSALLLVMLWAAYVHKALPERLVEKLPDRLPESAVALASAVTALGTAGLAYCYIASAPVLLLHAFRARMPRERHFWTGLGFGIAVLTVVLGTIFWFATPDCLRNAAYVPFLAVVLLEVVIVGCPRVHDVRHFYHKLARSRADPKNSRIVAEYIESYRHLREHGNAFLIILMEVILAAALYSAVDNSVRFFGVIVIWILPAAIIWPLGTWLELEFPIAKRSGTTSDEEDSGRLDEKQRK